MWTTVDKSKSNRKPKDDNRFAALGDYDEDEDAKRTPVKLLDVEADRSGGPKTPPARTPDRLKAARRELEQSGFSVSRTAGGKADAEAKPPPSSDSKKPLSERSPAIYKMLLNGRPSAKVPKDLERTKVVAFMTTIKNTYRGPHWKVDDHHILDYPRTVPIVADHSQLVAIHLRDILNESVQDSPHARDWLNTVNEQTEAGLGIEAVQALDKYLMKPIKAERDKDMDDWETFVHQRGELPSAALTRLLDVRVRLEQHKIFKTTADVNHRLVNAMFKGPYKDKLSDLKVERKQGRLEFDDAQPHEVAQRFASELKTAGVIKDGVIHGGLGVARRAGGGGGGGDQAGTLSLEEVQAQDADGCLICHAPKHKHRTRNCPHRQEAWIHHPLG